MQKHCGIIGGYDTYTTWAQPEHGLFTAGRCLPCSLDGRGATFAAGGTTSYEVGARPISQICIYRCQLYIPDSLPQSSTSHLILTISRALGYTPFISICPPPLMEGEITTASSRRLPIELCEFVIDAVYDFYYQFIEASLVTLSACALVCRAWRPHAQMILFDTVLVRDSTTLRRFAVLLDKSPHLRGYVHRLAVRGYLHVPTSPAVLFPTVVHLRLPNLTHIYLQEITPEEKSTCSLPPNMKELPSVPIHPYFPSLLATFNYVRRVDLVRLRFSSFADLCRVLSSLPNLPQLLCDNVSWDVFGTLPSFVWSAILNRQSPGRRKPFLPKLSQLYVRLLLM